MGPFVIRRRLRSSARSLGAALVGLMLGVFAGGARAGVHVEIDGVRLAVVMQGEHPYVSLGGFAAARALEYEYSYIDDQYVLRNPDSDGRAAVMTFKPGQAAVVVDDEPRSLSVPPIESKEGLLVPLKDFASLVLDPAEAAQLTLRADEGTGSMLKAVAPALRKGATKLVFAFQGPPQATIRQYADRLEAELVFEGCRLASPLAPLELKSPEVTRVSFTESAELLQVRAAIKLAAPARIDAVYVANLGEYAVTIRTDQSPGGSAWDVPDRLPEAERAALAGCRVAIDPGHGGADRGAVGSGGRDEKSLVLAAARELEHLLDATGVEAVLVRQDDKLMPSAARIHVLNRGRFAAVVSLHARAAEAAPTTTLPQLFVLPVEAPAAAAPATTGAAAIPWADQPDPTERLQALRLAESVSAACAGLLGAPAEIVADPQALPLRRVLAPGVAVDLGSLEAFGDPAEPGFDRDPERRRVVFAVYRGVLGFLRPARRGGALPAAGGTR